MQKLSVKKKILLSLFLVMTLRTFQFFPGITTVQEIWLVGCFIFLLIVYPFWKIQGRQSISSFEVYLLLIMLLTPVISAVTAQAEFNQPIIYGILSQRSIMLLTGPLLLIHCMRRKIITASDIEKTLVFLAWATLILYLTMKLALNPADFISYGKGFIGNATIQGQEFFKLSVTFVIFGCFYYAFLGFNKKSKKHYMYAGLFFAYLVGDLGGRSLSIAMLSSFAFFIYRWSSGRRFFQFFPKIFIVSTVILVFAYLVDPDAFSDRVKKFSDAFTVAFTGQEVEDDSANARIIETLVAMPYIEKNTLFGNGNISSQWQDGYEGVLGAYFYPSDIGFLGVLYMYGIFGFLFFTLQYWFALRSASKQKIWTPNPLLDATKGTLLYTAVHSSVTGGFVHNAEFSLLFIALLLCLSRANKISESQIKIMNLELCKSQEPA